ncbi:cytochrome c3 family protein [Aurantivibrio plasticivorans]
MFGNKFIWLIWGLVTVALGGYYVYQFEGAEDKSALLIGDTSHGHFQIEMACSSCHTDPFGGPEILQNACLNCHQDELKAADDSHPKSKFTDPRNADRVKILDARYCITCHTEHDKDNTLDMGLTIPEDYCFHCHQEIFEERPSHEGMGFETCATSGCHNYHDNRALYEDFLIEHGTKPAMLPTQELPALVSDKEDNQLTLSEADAPLEHQNATAMSEWHESAHAQKGVQCSDCHQPQHSDSWIEKPGIAECSTCHTDEATSFTQGKHGMRLSSTLDTPLNPVTPALVSSNGTPLAFNPETMNQTHGCNTCHGAHTFNTQSAAVNACLSCHSDDHSQAYINSPHAALWEKEITGTAEPGTGVSCATCHMPREVHDDFGNITVSVQHNQNANLRPNEKMIRSVCMNCHGLGFSIDALADDSLINSNFHGQPTNHIPSIDMAIERAER